MIVYARKLCPLCLLHAGLVWVTACLVCWPSKTAEPANSAVETAPFLNRAIPVWGVCLLAGILIWGARSGPPPTQRDQLRPLFDELLRERIAAEVLEQVAPCGLPDPKADGKRLAEVLRSHEVTLPTTPGIQVVILYNPGCPACRRLERPLADLKRALAEKGIADRVAFFHQPVRYAADYDRAALLLHTLRNAPEIEDLRQAIWAAPKDTDWSKDDILSTLLTEVGIDPKPALAKLAAPAALEEFDHLSEDLAGLGIDSLPAVFIDGRLLPNTTRNYSGECLYRAVASGLLAAGKISLPPHSTSSTTSRPASTR